MTVRQVLDSVPTHPYAALQAFLVHPSRPEGTLRYHQLQGFLFAGLSAPEVVRPSEWMPAIFNDQEAVYADLEEAQLVLGELMRLYNSINAAILDETVSLPDDCRFADDLLSNLDDDAPVAQWSRGFMAGYDWLEDSWDPYIGEELDQEFGSMLLVLSFFSSRDVAEGYRAELQKENLEELAAEVRELFPQAMFDHATLGRTIQRVASERPQRARPTPAVKTGRNEPCPPDQMRVKLR